MNGKRVVIVSGNDPVERAVLLKYCSSRKYDIHVVSKKSGNDMNDVPFYGRSMCRNIIPSISCLNMTVGSFEGLWYELTTKISSFVADLINVFFSEFFGKIKGMFESDKVKAYMGKHLAMLTMSLFTELSLYERSELKGESLIVIDCSINRKIIEYFEKEFKCKLEILWVKMPGMTGYFIDYYVSFLVEVFRRGFCLSRGRKKYKVVLEALWGFDSKTLKNDFMVDGKNIKVEDVLMFRKSVRADRMRENAFEQAKLNGYQTETLSDLKISLCSGFKGMVSRYFFRPLSLFSGNFDFRLLKCSINLLKEALPMEILINRYDINTFVSLSPFNDVSWTLVLNSYGAKSISLYYSDLLNCENYLFNFNAHDVYFTWGKKHFEVQKYNSNIVDIVETGCIYKESIARESTTKTDLLKSYFPQESPLVVFFDNSFNEDLYVTSETYVEYLEIISEFCKKHPEVNVMLKCKNEEDFMKSMSVDKYARYSNIMDDLTGLDNFIRVMPPQIGCEPLIAAADVTVTMCMTTPSLLALLNGKEALYYDNTGNDFHPIAGKFRDQLVFRSRSKLIERIEDIIAGRFHVKDVLEEEFLQEFDSFRDERAMERIRTKISELV